MTPTEAALASLDEVQEMVRDARSRVLRASAEPAAPTLEELTGGSGVSVDAVVAFITAAGELLGDTPLSVDAARRAAIIVAASQVWERELGPLLTTRDVATLLGGVSRQRVDELVRQRRLVAMRSGDGRWRYPAFQFDDGRPSEPLAEAFWTLVDAPLDPWSAASWCVAPDDALGGATPVGWLRDGRAPERLIQVATQDAARLAR